MRRFVCLALLLSLFSVGMVGCGEKASVKKETTTSTPGGETTTTTTTEVEKSGENPPPAQP